MGPCNKDSLCERLDDYPTIPIIRSGSTLAHHTAILWKMSLLMLEKTSDEGDHMWGPAISTGETHQA